MLLILMAILPALILLVYVYKKDPYKEPLGLLIWSFVLGALAAPCSSFFSSMLPGSIQAGPFLSAAYTATFQAAIPEELAKFILLYGYIWDNRHFDDMFDGIVYASIIGLGFASLENITYVMEYGPSVIISRGLLAVPGHFFFGVAMGYFFALAKFYTVGRAKYLVLSLAVPIVLHATYDGLLMWAENLNTWFSIILMLLFYFFVTRLWKYGIREIRLLQNR